MTVPYLEANSFFSVNGISIKSDFTVDVMITVADTLGEMSHE